jgi:hypothetical protein
MRLPLDVTARSLDRYSLFGLVLIASFALLVPLQSANTMKYGLISVAVEAWFSFGGSWFLVFEEKMITGKEKSRNENGSLLSFPLQ